MNRLISVAGAALVLGWAATCPAIDFQDTIEAARAAEKAATPEERRPLVITFSSVSCVWCRKLEVDTFPSPEVAAVADKFLWVKTDVDENEALAARFNVRGLPQTYVLDADDRIIASQPGYLAPEKFAAFLTNALENPQPLDDVLPNLLAELSGAEPEERPSVLTRVVEYVARADAEGRQSALRAVDSLGKEAWPTLLELLGDERLSVRAAAGGTLAHVAKSGIAFDAFAPDEERTQQVAAWTNWIAEQRESGS